MLDPAASSGAVGGTIESRSMRVRALPVVVATVLVLPLGLLPAGAAPAGTPLPVLSAAAEGGSSPSRLTGPTAPEGSTVTGEVRRLDISLKDGRGHQVTVVVPEEGRPVRVQDEGLDGIATGSVVSVELAAVTATSQDVQAADGGSQVLDVETLEEAPAADGPVVSEGARASAWAAAPQLGGAPRPVYLITATIPGQSPDSVRTADLRADVESHVDPYFAESTSGGLRLRVAGGRNGVRIPWWGPRTTCDLMNFSTMTYTVQDIVGPGYGWGSGGTVVVYTPTVAACAAVHGVAEVADGGLAWINGSRSAAPTHRRGVMTQKIGSTLTLERSALRHECHSSSNDADGYAEECSAGVDPFDVMGDSRSAGRLNGAHLGHLGAFPEKSLTHVFGTAQVTLRPVNYGSGIRYASLFSGGTFYYLEYRTDEDALVGGRPAPGVYIHRTDWGPTALLAASDGDPEHDPAADAPRGYALEPGRSFRTADNGMEVTLTSQSSIGATVQVTEAPTPWVAFTAVEGAELMEEHYTNYTNSGSDYVTTQPTVDLTWSVDPTLEVEAQELWRNGRRMLTLPPEQRTYSVSLREGWNHLVVKQRIGGELRVRTGRASVVLDTTPPRSEHGTLWLRTGTVTDSIPADLIWRSSDEGSGVEHEWLLNPLKDLYARAPDAALVRQPIGTKVWTVRVEDYAGHTAQAAISRTLEVIPDSRTTQVGQWARVSSSVLLGGRALRTSTQGATTSWVTRGRSVGWVASTGPGNGRVAIHVDKGTDQATTYHVDLSSPTVQRKQLVFVYDFFYPGSHTVEVVVTSSGKPVTSDGFVVVK